MLSALAATPPKVYAGGPFSDRSGSHQDSMSQFLPIDADRTGTWRSKLSAIHAAYREGVAPLDARSGRDGFLGLGGAGKDRVLAGHLDVPSVPDGYSGFTDMLFAHAIEGMHSAPEYGGNASLVGWHNIDFPGDAQPRGYQAAVVSAPLSTAPYQPSPVGAGLIHLLAATAPTPIAQP